MSLRICRTGPKHAGGAAAACALLVAAVAAAPAPAQLPELPSLPGLPPPGNEPPPPPLEVPPAAGAGGSFGDVVSYRMNPQHTGATRDDSVFGPLRKLWSVRYPDGRPASQPLIVPGRVIVNLANSDSTQAYGSHVIAYDPRTGRRAWMRNTPGTYFSSHIAIDGGRLVSVNYDGIARAFAVRDGRPLWNYRAGRFAFVDAPPVAAGGTAYFTSEYGSAYQLMLYAVNMSTGQLRWKRELPIDAYGAFPALDRQRVYVANSCGDAAAVRRSDGEVVWSRLPEPECTYGGGMVLGGRLYTPGPEGTRGEGAVYDAATGAPRGRLPGGAPDAAAGGTGFDTWRHGAIRALSLANGRTRWKLREQPPYDDPPLPPILVGATAFATSTHGRLLGLDAVSGARFSAADHPYELEEPVGGPEPGMSAGHGVLVATGGARLTAYAPLLRPPPRGTDVAASTYDLVWHRPLTAWGGLGGALRHAHAVRPVRLETDPYPYNRFHTAGRRTTRRDGVAVFKPVLERNTRLRLRAAGARGAARVATVYVYPRLRERIRARSHRRVELRVYMRAGPSFRVGGHRMIVYYHRRGHERAFRVATTTVEQTGRGKARAKAVFRIPSHATRHDGVIWCVKDTPAWGRPDRPGRRCGANRVDWRA